jgi:hypothetical protein
MSDSAPINPAYTSLVCPWYPDSSEKRIPTTHAGVGAFDPRYPICLRLLSIRVIEQSNPDPIEEQ